jgi:antitoxin MazE
VHIPLAPCRPHALTAAPPGRNAVIQHIGYTVSMSEERTFITVQSRGLIAIPTSIRRNLGLDQPGAQVEVIERGGEIVLRPHVAVPADQAWFWSERWQRREREADEAIDAGRITALEGVEELLAELES